MEPKYQGALWGGNFAVRLLYLNNSHCWKTQFVHFFSFTLSNGAFIYLMIKSTKKASYVRNSKIWTGNLVLALLIRGLDRHDTHPCLNNMNPCLTYAYAAKAVQNSISKIEYDWHTELTRSMIFDKRIKMKNIWIEKRCMQSHYSRAKYQSYGLTQAFASFSSYPSNKNLTEYPFATNMSIYSSKEYS